jgi:SET domain
MSFPDSTTHGIGRFTTGFIPRGTEIEKEQPFFHLCEGESIILPGAMQDPRWQTWLNLRLPTPTPADPGAIYDRFRVTSLRCGTKIHDEKSVEASGVFLRACRFNSSCQPNVQAHWNPNTECMHFLALRNIEPGEELYICYDPPALLSPRAERRQTLRIKFGFSCNCVICNQTSPNSDKRRAALKPIIEGVPNPPNADKATPVQIVSSSPSIGSEETDEARHQISPI